MKFENNIEKLEIFNNWNDTYLNGNKISLLKWYNLGSPTRHLGSSKKSGFKFFLQ